MITDRVVVDDEPEKINKGDVDPGEFPDRADRSTGSEAAARVAARGVKAGFALATVVLLGLGVLFGLQVRSDAIDTNHRDTALMVARDRVLELTTLSYKDIDRQLQSLLDSSTGEFRRQFQGTLGTFAEVVRRSKVEATGTVAEVAMVRLGDEAARIFVAATATVKNADSKSPEPRRYRLAVDLERVGDDWLVSGMEFVP